MKSSFAEMHGAPWSRPLRVREHSLPLLSLLPLQQMTLHHGKRGSSQNLADTRPRGQCNGQDDAGGLYAEFLTAAAWSASTPQHPAEALVDTGSEPPG